MHSSKLQCSICTRDLNGFSFCLLHVQGCEWLQAGLTLPLVVLMALSACPLVMNVANPNPFRVPEAHYYSANKCKTCWQIRLTLRALSTAAELRSNHLQCFLAEKDPTRSFLQLQALLSTPLASPDAVKVNSEMLPLCAAPGRLPQPLLKHLLHWGSASLASHLESQVANDKTPFLEMQPFPRHLASP